MSGLSATIDDETRHEVQFNGNTQSRIASCHVLVQYVDSKGPADCAWSRLSGVRSHEAEVHNEFPALRNTREDSERSFRLELRKEHSGLFRRLRQDCR